MMLAVAAFASKLLLYGAALGAIGAGMHRGIGLISSRRLSVALAGAVAAAAALRLVIVNAEMGGGLGAALSTDTFAWTWGSLGPQATAFLAGAGLLLAGALAGSRILAAVAAIAIAAGFGLAGHSAGLEEPGIAPAVVGLHVLIAGFWFFAPVSLWPRADLSENEVTRRTRTFSRVAVALVPVLFLSGVWLLWRIGGGVDGVLASLYGRLLLGKLGVAAAILGLGALNMTVVTKRLAAAPASGRKALRATLGADAVLFFGVLLLIASATSFTGPNE